MSRYSTALLESNSFKKGNAIRFPSPAKLNLFLYINGKRPDGYHELQTLFQFLDYGDWLEISLRDDEQIIVTPEIPDLPVEQNLIYRAAKALQQKAQEQTSPNLVKSAVKFGATIHLEKVLPMGGGVGGGSSNAATALVALNYLWNTQFSTEELIEIGVKLGADVPIFIAGHSALAEGVGEKISPCEPEEKWYLVLKPDVSISTARVFSDPNLTRNTPKKPISQLFSEKYANDCEKVVRNHYSKVEDLLSWLVKYAPARLTGTGACVFAEFDSEQKAQAVFDLKPTDFTGFVAKGCNISPLHQWLNILKQQNIHSISIMTNSEVQNA